ncbi:MAG: hemerythrin domain-containing protein [Burkholderiales bacterium]
MAKTRKEPDAIELLKKDHRQVETLFKEFEKLHESDQHEAADQIVETICTELQIHDKLETEIFYPAVRAQAEEEEEDLLDEAEVEHTSVRELIQKIEDMGPGSDKRYAHVTVLVEYVKHHVKEEEKEMFPKVKKLDLDLKELGARMKERKTELMAEMGMETEAEEESEERESTH